MRKERKMSGVRFSRAPINKENIIKKLKMRMHYSSTLLFMEWSIRKRQWTGKKQGKIKNFRWASTVLKNITRMNYLKKQNENHSRWESQRIIYQDEW
jgi:hypothetical protein